MVYFEIEIITEIGFDACVVHQYLFEIIHPNASLHWGGYYCYLLDKNLETGPLFTKRTDVLPQDLAKSRSREIRV